MFAAAVDALSKVFRSAAGINEVLCFRCDAFSCELHGQVGQWSRGYSAG